MVGEYLWRTRWVTKRRKNMKKNIVWITLGVIVALAAVLRFWQLGAVPVSPDWDEVALGYNAYSILHTGRDEYSAFLPIVLKSYGDYKPALYAYIDIPAIWIFGLNTFAVRLPSALLGVLTIVLTFFLVKELFKKNSLALLAAFSLSISPWHIQFSRVAFEANVGVFFNVLGALLFLKALRKPWLLIPSAIVFACNLYVYQSEKIFTPLLALFLVMLFAKQVFSLPKKVLFTTLLVGIIFAFPITFYTLFSPNGLARAQGVSIFSSATVVSGQIADRYLFNKAQKDILGLVLDNGRLVYAKEIIGNYLSHFSINWLFITGDIARHHAPDMGLLYLWELPCIAMGIYQLIFGTYSKKTKILIFGWFLLAPLPAAITNDVPHAVRTMNFLPIYPILTAIGLLYLYNYMKSKKMKYLPFGYICIGLYSIFIIFNGIYYIDQYFIQQNYFNDLDWQYGYAQAVPATQQFGVSYKQIVVDSANQLSQSYMFYLFYLQENPVIYQQAGNQVPSGKHAFGKYTFRPIDWKKDQHMQHALFVGNAGDFPQGVQGSKKMIYTVDGKPLIEIVGT